ncbi:hypothetical protein [Microcoleus sp. BROC3]|uniref:hypothetical protein n=1 Tax=Microcoleus sp. BROC3 TaxID=3055323 RepID=UPI002FD5836C
MLGSRKLGQAGDRHHRDRLWAQPKRLLQNAVKFIGDRETAIGYNKGLEEKNTDNPKIWLPSRTISTLPP